MFLFLTQQIVSYKNSRYLAQISCSEAQLPHKLLFPILDYFSLTLCLDHSIPDLSFSGGNENIAPIILTVSVLKTT